MADLASVTALALQTLDECYAAAGLPTVAAQLTALPVVTSERDAAVALATARRTAIDAMIAAAQADADADAAHAAGQGVLTAGAGAP